MGCVFKEEFLNEMLLSKILVIFTYMKDICSSPHGPVIYPEIS